MKKLRLLLFDDCKRNCVGCCNNDWNLDALPVVESYAGYAEVLLTGGEPMLDPQLVIATAREIRRQSDAKIYVYMAKIDIISDVCAVLAATDGICVTLHTQEDVPDFVMLWIAMEPHDKLLPPRKSLRLNVFEGVKFPHHKLKYWKVKLECGG